MSAGTAGCGPPAQDPEDVFELPAFYHALPLSALDDVAASVILRDLEEVS